MAWADAHQGGGLIQCHVRHEQAVQNLYPSPLSLRQCHFLHRDIFAVQSARTLSLNNDSPSGPISRRHRHPARFSARFSARFKARVAVVAEQSETGHRPVLVELSPTETVCIQHTPRGGPARHDEAPLSVPAAAAGNECVGTG